mmetsp:Transcript_57206/g.100125  ORF Transcript_57206/g.100125 Transcript_57206/m.100125 type:complete len:108 (-) Transcript_57206:1174-1497(-)
MTQKNRAITGRTRAITLDHRSPNFAYLASPTSNLSSTLSFFKVFCPLHILADLFDDARWTRLAGFCCHLLRTSQSGPDYNERTFHDVEWHCGRECMLDIGQSDDICG